ncbi:Hypothetical protein A7982_00330 [Minicystis rosea]|nr:Hypothetical protein A7982_00330 [Minicystis rosea]
MRVTVAVRFPSPHLAEILRSLACERLHDEAAPEVPKGYVCKLIQRAVDRLRAAGWEVSDA